MLNGSPKGKNSITLQTVLYLEKLHPEHEFTILHIGQRIRQYEKDLTEVLSELDKAELILFCYPVYTFIAPYQMHRLIELVKESGMDLHGKIASQITTSKHFYDITAHRFIEENCLDWGMQVIRGLSADMDDLLTEKGQQEARMFFEQLMFGVEHHCYERAVIPSSSGQRTGTTVVFESIPKTSQKDVVIVTNCAEEDVALAGMIENFCAVMPCPVRVINIRKFPFAGGCLGCFGCAITGKCVYKDGFDEYLRKEIQTADAIVYAFAVENHYTHSSMKNYDDRQFCNGHRTVTQGMPVAYLIRGDYHQEPNLRMIVEARSEVGGNYLAGIATDEFDMETDIRNLAQSLCQAMKSHWHRPQNFYGVGGMKIFRDLIYVMQGLMKADHRFYKAHGIYDFPQKQKGRILQMKLVGLLLSIPSAQKKMKGQMSDYIIAPYQKVIEKAGTPPLGHTD